MATLPVYEMKFEPNTIEHLGLKLYSHLPPVIGELISNGYDADASEVNVTLPIGRITSDMEVIIRDNGSGMSSSELQDAYLKIGRNRREASGSNQSAGGRRVMGRKGLGKLSAFGIATELEVRTVKDGFGTCIRLNYDDMKAWSSKDPYRPTIILERTGKTDEASGTEIKIKQLRRKSPIDVAAIRKQIARRFTVIGYKFQVIINDIPITSEDRRLKEECRYCWENEDLPLGVTIDEEKGWTVQGWIGFLKSSSQTERGVDIFANEKAVELDSMFNNPSTHAQYARAFLAGEIHANFLDDEEDSISTARTSVQWEFIEGQKLQEWGRGTLQRLFKEWVKQRQKEKEQAIIHTEDFDKWLQSRNPREQKVAKKLIKVIVSDEKIEPESAKPLLEIIKTNIEFQAFQDLVSDIEESGANISTFLSLLNEWRVLEAREVLKISDGRLEIMQQLASFIRKGALEVQEIQPFFEENGWLIDPTWINVSGQNRYTELLREHCNEPADLPESDRRMDILGYDASGTLHIVELKRPKKRLSRKDLAQIEDYVDWARSHLVTSGTIKYVHGTLVVGELSSNAEVLEKQRRLIQSDIKVETFDSLLDRAYKVFCDNELKLKMIAPEYYKDSREPRKSIIKR